MKYKEFEKIVNLLVTQYRKLEDIKKLGINLYDILEDWDITINLLFEQILTDEGNDWLNWFLYEANYISGEKDISYRAYDNKHREICKTLKGLHSYLIKNKYFKI